MILAEYDEERHIASESRLAGKKEMLPEKQKISFLCLKN